MEDALKLKLNTLPFGIEVIECHVDEAFFDGVEHADVRHADVDVALQVNRLGETDYRLDITCRGTLTIPCDRCLDDMVHEVDATYGVTVKQEGTVLDDSHDDLLLVPASWSELDAAPLVRDTVLLTLPLTHCHATREECNSDMLALLDDHSAGVVADDEGTGEGATDPRWDALKKLKGEK